MNLILFERDEIGRTLSPTDPRTVHIREVLKRKPGQSFDCGIINGSRGEGIVESDSSSGMCVRFRSRGEPPSLDPVWLAVGLPRPQTARRILFEATTMGVERLLFFQAEKARSSYAQSKLWHGDAVRRQLIAAAEQAFCTRLPKTGLLKNLAEVLAGTSGAVSKIALDNYESNGSLSDVSISNPPTLVTVGPERGWSANERDQLRENGFALVHLGARVLRTETACVASIALIKDKMGIFSASGGTPLGCSYTGS